MLSEIVGNNNKRKKEEEDSMLYQGTGAFNCTYNTISSKARVSDETTQPLKNRHLYTQHSNMSQPKELCDIWNAFRGRGYWFTAVASSERFSHNVVGASRMPVIKHAMKYHGNPRETKHPHEALDWAVLSFPFQRSSFVYLVCYTLSI